MSGDPASRNDDELLDQIDELKARMDRLMRGGTSTSNSALLTEEEKLKAAGGRGPEKAPEPSQPAARTRVRDLIETEDTEVVEGYVGRKEVVPFPADANPLPPEPKKSVAPPAASPPKPELKPPVRSKDGSLISLDSSAPEGRPQAASFDELGNAIQQELAKDDSVPPVGSKKGPDLASRFGSRDESTKPATVAVPEKEFIEPEVAEELPLDEEVEVFEDVVEEDEFDAEEPAHRRSIAKVAAIWVATALASGTIATLHFTGMF